MNFVEKTSVCEVLVYDRNIKGIFKLIEDLNYMPSDLIENVRRTHGINRTRLLWSKIHPDHRRYLDAFVRDVVENNCDPMSWGRGGVLVPDLYLSELLAMSVSEIIEPLGEGRWCRLVIDDRVDASDSFALAPVALCKDMHYSWIPPECVVKISPGAVSVTSVSRIDVAVRRWVAFRAAKELGSLRGSHLSSFEIAEAVDFPAHSLSPDAQVALQGLAQEMKHGIAPTQTHGFVGSDASYSV